MKKMKKLLALLLAAAMAMAMGITSFAENDASITIENAVKGETYTAYKLFDVSKSDDGKYSYYTANESLKAALEGEGLTFDASADGSRYTVKQVTVTSGEGDEATSEVYFDGGNDVRITAAQLAERINTKIKEGTSALKSALRLSGTGTSNANEEGGKAAVTISGLTPGYYFVDSTLGSLCALDTAAASATIYEKNSIPSIKKEVKEDSTGKYHEKATIDVIDTISYKLTVNTGSNEEGSGTGVDANYVIADTLPEGISYKTNTVKISVDTKASDGNTISTEWNASTENESKDYTVTWDATSSKLTVTLLASGKLKDLPQNTDIVITYDATVQTAGTISYGYQTGQDGSVADLGKKNTAVLTYQSQRSEASATVYTYEIGGSNFTKKNGNDVSAQPLGDVVFILSKTEQNGGSNTTKYAAVDASGYLTGWKNEKAEATELKTDPNGHITVKGLDADTYILTETATLSGYNLLDDTITVTISDTGAVTYKLTKSTGNAEGSITVVNKTGSLLPSTGGAGTTIFYVLGAILAVGAGVLLVVRRRMDAEK